MYKIICILFVFICFSNVSIAQNNDKISNVLNHYELLGDKEKLRAAQFLIDNMQKHEYLHSQQMSELFKKIVEINANYTYPLCVEKFDSIYNLYSNVEENLKIYSDIDSLSVNQLITNIDSAFEDWRNGYWAKHLNFEQFCEYLLPYKVCEEKPESFRSELRKRYYERTSGVRNSVDQCHSPYWAACSVNGLIRRRKFHNKRIWLEDYVELPISTLKDIRMGECLDYAKYTVYVMRACGIPVSLDYTPQWPNRANNHHWNGLLDNTGKTIPFMGGESNPGEPCKHGSVMAKVYRYTFGYQRESVYEKNRAIGEELPPWLDTPFIKDVSNEYFNGVDITIHLKNTQRHFVYLAVFDNIRWVPVDYAVVEAKGIATFHSIGKDIVYLPVYWQDGHIVPVGNPIFVDLNGNIIDLKPQKDNTCNYVLKRKYPLFRRIFDFRNLMYNGRIEASNDSAFQKVEKIATIKNIPLDWYDTILVETKQSYRYWRYVAPRNSKCNVAEIKFFSHGKQLLFDHTISDGTSADGFDVSFAFDGNELSYYESNKIDNGWIGVDFGSPITIDSLCYLPRYDDNHVKPGHIYELMYYDEGIPISLGIQQAKSDSILFERLPQNALFILHDKTSGSEERIFTLKEDEIHWH